MEALSRFSADEIEQVENSSPCEHARARVSRAGSLFAAVCKSRDEQYCSWCSYKAYQAKLNLNDLVLSTILPGQAVWMTLTAPSKMTRSKSALWNSMIVPLMTNFLQRVKKSFGDVAYVYSIERSNSTSNKNLHIHLALVRHDSWSRADLTVLREHSRDVMTYSRKGKTGSELKFGRVTHLEIPETKKHLENISRYMLKESGVKLSTCKSDREMSRFIDNLRALRDHRFKPTTRKSHLGGLGFRGQKVHWSRNWIMYQYLPEKPVLELPTCEPLQVGEPENPTFTVLSAGDTLTEQEFSEYLNRLDDPIPIE